MVEWLLTFWVYFQTVSFLTYVLVSCVEYISGLMKKAYAKAFQICLWPVQILLVLERWKPFVPFLCSLFNSEWYHQCLRGEFFALIILREMQELLASLKFVFGMDFKRGLCPFTDTLLDERNETYEAYL